MRARRPDESRRNSDRGVQKGSQPEAVRREGRTEAGTEADKKPNNIRERENGAVGLIAKKNNDCILLYKGQIGEV